MTATDEIIEGEIVEGTGVAVQSVTPTQATTAALAMADVERVGTQMEVMETFIASKLVEKKHYGKVPGAQKPFLWQAGAELILRIFNARAMFTTLDKNIGPKREDIFYEVKCEVVTVGANPVLLSEADAICVATESSFKNSDISMLPNNVSARARKRALVMASRTLGCTSAFFTQDEDMVPSDSGGDSGSSGAASGGNGKARGTKMDLKPDNAQVGYYMRPSNPKNNKSMILNCEVQGWGYATQWNHGDRDSPEPIVKCTKKMKGTDDYCEFFVPDVGPLPVPDQPQSTNPTPAASPAQPAPTAQAAPAEDARVEEFRSLLQASADITGDDLKLSIPTDSEGKIMLSAIKQWFIDRPAVTAQELLEEIRLSKEAEAAKAIAAQEETPAVEDVPF